MLMYPSNSMNPKSIGIIHCYLQNAVAYKTILPRPQVQSRLIGARLVRQAFVSTRTELAQIDT
jgi:hypothetical protein